MLQQHFWFLLQQYSKLFKQLINWYSFLVSRATEHAALRQSCLSTRQMIISKTHHSCSPPDSFNMQLSGKTWEVDLSRSTSCYLTTTLKKIFLCRPQISTGLKRALLGNYTDCMLIIRKQSMIGLAQAQMQLDITTLGWAQRQTTSLVLMRNHAHSIIKFTKTPYWKVRHGKMLAITTTKPITRP